MNDTYDPLKDPAADGFKFVGTAVDPAIEQALAPSKEDWEAALTGANAAPDATPAQSNRFWSWFKWGAVALFLGICWLAYSQYQVHKAEVAQIQNPSSGSPEIGASPKNKGLGHGKSHAPNKADKSATDKIANKAINTTASDGFYGLKPSGKKPSGKKPSIEDGFTNQFNKDLSQFETSIKKEFP